MNLRRAQPKYRNFRIGLFPPKPVPCSSLALDLYLILLVRHV